MRRSFSVAAIAILALPVAGCISFGGKPPKMLLTLAATAQPDPGRAQTSASARSIVIEVLRTGQQQDLLVWRVAAAAGATDSEEAA